MNYLFFYYGEIPKYVELALNNILNIEKNAEIFLITDKKINSKYINTLDISKTNLLEKLETINDSYTKFNLDFNPLWATSLLRIFALQSLKNYFKIDRFVHFDTDVLIYKSFEDTLENYRFSESKISITPNDYKSLVFGYSYFPNEDLVDKLVDLLNKNISDLDFIKHKYTNGHDVSEMRHLGILNQMYPELFNLLPILPYDNHEVVFDPAGYGQYLNGTHVRRGNYIFKRRWISMKHIVGSELKSKRIKLKFKENPYVVYDKKNVELVNLHIHSKNILKFLPPNQESYITL